MRRRIVLLLVFALVGSTARVSLAQIADAEKAARAKDWKKALAAYEAANMAAPSADALEGAANARYQLKQDGEAYAAYAEWLEKYGAKAPPQKRATARARLNELEARTGTLAIDVNEAGAQISVDDKLKGFAPLRAPLRLSAGPHRLRITKDGFAPFEAAPNVAAGTPTTVTVKLESPATKGRLVVREKSGKPLRVLVDGVDMGDAPWSGELDAGSHEISGKSSSMAAAPAKVTIERGKETVVELEASSTIAPLKISTSDGKGLIYLDDKLVGEGSFVADVPAGPHKIRVTREGYDSFEEEIVLKDKEPLARSITLKLGSKIETGPVQEVLRPLEGLYGGFQLMGALGLGGMDSSPEKLCNAGDRPPEVASCDSGSAVGGGVGGFLGYHWDPVGVELFMLAQYDQQSPTFTWNASSVDPGIGPDPARTEEFKIRRAGGLAAARVRLTLQGEKVRFSAAGGLGLSTRSLFLTRDTRSITDPSLADKLVSDGQGYLSLALSLEPSIQYRLGETTALMAGLSFVVDNPTSLDEVPRTPPEANHRLGANGLTTPSYELTSGTQVWTGVFVGMMFGP